MFRQILTCNRYNILIYFYRNQKTQPNLSQSKDVIQEGLTSLNVPVIKFYDVNLFHYIH